MKALLKKIVAVVAGGVIAASAPSLLLAKGGAYTSTRHGNPVTGVNRIFTEPAGSCSQCHYEHASYDGASTGGPYDYALFAADDNTLCYTCHNLQSITAIYQGATVYNQSSHALSNATVWPGPNPPSRPGSDAGKCVNCHNPHGVKDAWGVIPNLGFLREENLCLGCHGAYPASKNILLQVQKSYRHPVSQSGLHAAGEGDPARYGISPANRRHAECEDCHNPHYAKADPLQPAPPVATNRIVGVSRVKVNNGAAGTVPVFSPAAAGDTTFVREYEICFKCHSSWTTQPVGQTDLPVFFNPNNPSFHPVEAQGKNLNIRAGAFVNGWTATSQMYCTDCHTSDDTTVRGPHGSTYRYILKKNYVASSGPLPMGPDDLCFDCHQFGSYADGSAPAATMGLSRFNPPAYASGHTFHVSGQGYPCYACHGSHGSTTQPGLIMTGRTPGLISYTQTADGGTCTPTCHGPRTYSINYPR